LDEILFNVDDRYLVIEEEEREEETSALAAAAASADPLTTDPPPNRQSKPRKGSTVTFPKLVGTLKKRHKKNFKKLTMRGRCDKARYILADLLAMCVADADKLNRYGSTYLNNNKKELA